MYSAVLFGQSSVETARTESPRRSARSPSSRSISRFSENLPFDARNSRETHSPNWLLATVSAPIFTSLAAHIVSSIASLDVDEFCSSRLACI